jgi:hypothetical protein
MGCIRAGVVYLHAAHLIEESRTTRKTNMQMKFFIRMLGGKRNIAHLQKVCRLSGWLQVKHHAK